MSRVLLASGNAKKLAELRRIVAPLVPGVEVLGLADLPDPDAWTEPVEDGATFVENALIKARAAHALTGWPSLADDSGLCVDALNGMPGVLSARWSGPPKDDARNNRLLLDQLVEVPDPRRGGHFACAVALVHGPVTAPVEQVVEGRMAGRVEREVRGSGGFGYDVLFTADDRPGLTTAELDVADKDAISHRGRALRAMAPILAAALGS
ncbi:RdgB/HAM1 family non-canonical purine NTP pyrophosphatase [Nocardioides lentus]|uniref:dITP/XTP pyrophosphatase n=1 Tax=Nocardioides lentus TaxID=338077 RepID=A0ABN2PHI6_9ACTN